MPIMFTSRKPSIFSLLRMIEFQKKNQFEPAITAGCPFHVSLVGHCNFSSPNCPITAFDKEFNMEKRVEWLEIDGRQMWSKCRRMQICRNRRWDGSTKKFWLFPIHCEVASGDGKYIEQHWGKRDNWTVLLVWKEARECVYIFRFKTRCKTKWKLNEKYVKVLSVILHVIFAYGGWKSSSILKARRNSFELKQKFMQSLFVAMGISYSKNICFFPSSSRDFNQTLLSNFCLELSFFYD